jgi:septal ring factor EnvC (AmiA/AmiB activator)
MDVLEVVKIIPKEHISLVLGMLIIIAVLGLVLYAIRTLYPIFKKNPYSEISCLAHSSVNSRIEKNELNLEDYENRLAVMEKNIATMEEHNRRTDQRLDSVESSLKDLISIVLPLGSKVESIEAVIYKMDEKIDRILWKNQ